jgi:hypothetical protein
MTQWDDESTKLYCVSAARHDEAKADCWEESGRSVKPPCTHTSNVRFVLFCDITQRWLVVLYRRFGATYPSPRAKTSRRFLILEDGPDRLSRNVGTELPIIAASYSRRAQVSSTSWRKPEITDQLVYEPAGWQQVVLRGCCNVQVERGYRCFGGTCCLHEGIFVIYPRDYTVTVIQKRTTLGCHNDSSVLLRLTACVWCHKQLCDFACCHVEAPQNLVRYQRSLSPVFATRSATNLTRHILRNIVAYGAVSTSVFRGAIVCGATDTLVEEDP